jgi:AraC-like DNA-binding protein
MHGTFSDAFVATEAAHVPLGEAAAHSCVAATFFASGRYTHIRKTSDVTAADAFPVAPSISPEMCPAAEGEDQSLHRLLLDEVESVNRLYKVVSEAGCDVVFYDESGELAGRYGRSQPAGRRLPARRAPAPVSPLASPIFNADGSFVGSLDLTSLEGDCTGTVATLMQKLVCRTAHAVEERAFRKRHAGEWIVALAPPDGAASGMLLAVDRNHRVVGADRRARTTLLKASEAPAAFWSLFEKNPAIFASPQGEDRPVVLARLGAAEAWPALITAPASERARTPAQLDLHARPRLDIVGCLPAQPAAGASRGGMTPRALRRVRDHIDAHLAQNISLEALAEVAGLSRCHFARAFKQSVGIAPHSFVMQRRLERAERLLAETDFSLCQVALDSGFSDQSHFSSCFRRHFGVSPRSFRRSRR